MKGRLTLALLVGVCGCHHLAAPQPEPDAPPGEVWLSPQQVRDARIQIAELSTHDVDDTILTSGSVALDDFYTPATSFPPSRAG